MNKLLIFLFLLSFFSTAQEVQSSKNQTCTEVLDCLKIYSSLTGKKLLFDKDINGKVAFSENLKFTKQNSEVLISELLSMVGLAKVKLGSDIWKIINARDIRYTPTPIINGYTDQIPENSDYIQAIFKLKNVDFANEIVRNFRPFMTRYGRILDVKRSNTILVTDTGINIIRLKNLISFLDVPEPNISKEILKARKEKKEFNQKIALLKAKNCTAEDNYFRKSSRAQSSSSPSKK